MFTPKPAGLARAPAARWRRAVLALWLGAMLALGLAGCGSLPKDVERPVSQALAEPTATPLGRLAAQRRPPSARERDSGFALIDSANMAYSSRLALTRQASRTLDIQYYAIHADASTAELLREVRAAAARGVRVRILLDDFHSTGQDALVMGMAFLPGVEMRMFNPLPGGRGAGMLRALGSLHDFQRMQHRMHNKLYIADNAWGITGGRNLGDAYFGTADGSNFIDMDVLAVGPVVQAMSASFDRYWNNPLAYPVQSLVTPAELRALRASVDGGANGAGAEPVQTNAAAARMAVDEAAPANGADKPPPALPAALELAQLPLIWASAALLVDEPSKLVPELNDAHTEDTVVDGMLSLLQQARADALIVSPYFVPGPRMMQVFAELRRRGVRLRVLTNSLASNDAPLAHVGYARYRKQLVHLGVELYEMRAQHSVHLDRTVFGSGAGGSKASLHSKMLIIDGRVISIGSMNLDLRSKLQNTEVALVIRSRTLSRQAAAELEDALDDSVWRLELTPEGRLLWRAPPGAEFDDAQDEPDASLGLRLILNILGPLAPDEML
ncbi:phospholipase D family protein [Ottowia sp.]|uniref:phospholipase D family protein n=1 Tax=Ottowia sp. TaxID=1898956 RepID=UPI002BE192EB|nr:phospholipase D family protein [Ottowia sp.]HRN75639.1 phospholipase D family protein [Ottowia sp.]HRQ02926.1 phospholipase D family protein [Ottowia sp.]